MYSHQPSKSYQLALETLSILVEKAKQRHPPITYGELARLLGYRGASFLGYVLGYIQNACIKNRYPILTSLVVNKKTGIPGEGYRGRDFQAELKKCYEFNWDDVIPTLHASMEDEEKGV